MALVVRAWLRLLSLFIVVACSVFGLFLCKTVRPTSSLSNEQTHIGRWTGRDTSGRVGKISFYRSGLAAFSVANRHFGGSNMTSRGALLYQIDYTVTPKHLDLIGVNSSYKELRRIRFIIKFIGKKQLHACTFMNRKRPKNFDAKGKSCYKIIFRKIGAV